LRVATIFANYAHLIDDLQKNNNTILAILENPCFAYAIAKKGFHTDSKCIHVGIPDGMRCICFPSNPSKAFGTLWPTLKRLSSPFHKPVEFTVVRSYEEMENITEIDDGIAPLYVSHCSSCNGHTFLADEGVEDNCHLCISNKAAAELLLDDREKTNVAKNARRNKNSKKNKKNKKKNAESTTIVDCPSNDTPVEVVYHEPEEVFVLKCDPAELEALGFVI
jgi:hypothetical protein